MPSREEFKNITAEEMEAICEEKNLLEWYYEASNTLVPHKRHPRVEIVVNGKKKTIVDKTQPAEEVMEYPTFMEVKQRFLTEICGIAPVKKEKKPTFRERAKMLAGK